MSGEKAVKSYATSKQLEKIRHTVTGIGWASPQQAAIYTGLTHRKICESMNSQELSYSRIGQKTRRVRYKDLDTFMISHREEEIDFEVLTQRAKKALKSIELETLSNNGEKK